MVLEDATKIEPTVSEFGVKVKVTKSWTFRNLSDKPLPMGTKLLVNGNSSLVVKSTVNPTH
jgi:hypothetical protein